MKQFGFRIADSDPRIEPPAAVPAETIDLSRLFSAARRQRRVVMLSTAVSLCLGLVYLATTPKIFVAGSTVLLAGKVSRSIEEVSSIDSSASENALESAQEVIRSQPVALAVVDMLNLTENESFLNQPVSLLETVVDGGKEIVRAPIRMISPSPPSVEPGPPPTPEQIAERKRQLIATALSRTIEVQRVGRSSVFAIGYASHDPVLASKVANAYAEAYVSDLLNANYDATERTTAWLRDRLEALQASAREAAVEAEVFRSENGLVSTRGALITEENVSTLNEDLAVSVTEAARAQALMKTYESILNRGPEAFLSDRSSGFALQGNERLIEMQDQLSALSARLDRIERDFGNDHPQAVRLREQVSAQTNVLFGEVRRLHEEARGSYNVANAQVQALRESLGLAVDVNSEAGRKQVQLKSLEQRAETLQTLYQTFLTRFQEIDQQKSFPISNVRILAKADIPLTPAAPSTMRVLAAMIVLGLMAGAAIAAFREWRDRFLRTGEDVQNDLGQRFLGYLPHFDAANGAPQLSRQARNAPLKLSEPVPGMPVVRKPIHALQHPRSHYAETLRNIRFSSEVSLAGKSQIVLGITSIRPGEGKSSVALNLAAVMAASGNSVLLIDTDPRNPGLSRRLGLTRGVGLVEAALGRADWTKALRVIGDSGVHLLPCVTPGMMTHSSEMLGSKGMRQLLAAARARYSHVILDLAPLGPVVDARVVVPLVDQIVMVAEWGKTPKALVRETLMNEPALMEKTLGVVLNKVDMTTLRDYVSETGGEHYYEEYGDYFSGRSNPA
ncbi:GNVR domain-containing protein [Rhodobacter sp. CZR27]|uniref:GNVR domain-containing protein n=1 Tax=Rhodobacter sp. CZR27 TaxID=2033869 RepID=UPI000BBED0BA|nr:GNVR domain-containing protein [Rhodobacter sp. CZR27]